MGVRGPVVNTAVSPFYLDLTDAEIGKFQDTVGDILRSGRLVLGEHSARLESQVADTGGCRHAVAMNSGTSALEALFRFHGVEGKRVATPTNTNFATVAAIIRAGGTPVFLDMTPETFMPDRAMLEEAVGEGGIAGAVWVHIGGLIALDFFEIAEYCRDHGLFLIEVAAHAHGSVLGGRAAGTLADGGAYSFFATKVMTTCEGGMLTTDSDECAELARSLRNQGKRGQAFGNDHRDMGNSWRITEFAAAMGLIMLEKLDAMVSRRSRAAAAFAATLDEIGVPYCRFDHMDAASQYKLIVPCPEGETPRIKQSLIEEGVQPGGGVYDKPCHLQPVFESVGERPRPLPNAERWCPNHVCPPLTSGMSNEDIERVCTGLRRAFGAAVAGEL